MKETDESSKIQISQIIRLTAPKEKKPVLTPEQIENLKTAGGVALAILMSAGILTLSAVAPNVFVALDKLFLKKNRGRFNRKELEKQVTRTFYYLKKSGLVRMKPTAGDFKIYLTALARRKIKRMRFNNLRVEKQKKWDKKWWQVAADIPTKQHKTGADALRSKLKEMSFYPLQRTLWLYPYDPRLEVDWIIRTYRIERFVTIMEINRLNQDDEDEMTKFFKKRKIL